MQLEKFIEELLFSQNCVIVPGFGAFLANSGSARLEANTLSPPTKTISFNSQLTQNDGLLVSHVANKLQLSFEKALQQIEPIVKKWIATLDTNKPIEFPHVGTLSTNPIGKIEFEPKNTTNFLTTAYGLAPLVTIPIEREVFKTEMEEIEEKVPFIITPEKREAFSFRPLLKYAAVVLLAFSLGVTAYQAFESQLSNDAVVQQEVQKEVTKHIQEATFFEDSPIEIPPINLKITTASKPKTNAAHHIIAGAFRVKENAVKKVTALKKQGFDATYLGPNTYGLHRVAFASFNNAKEALDFLKQVRRSQTRDAWMLSEKK